MLRQHTTTFRILIYLTALMTLGSFILTNWLFRNPPDIPTNTTLSATQYVSLIRRGVTSPQLLYQQHKYSLTDAERFCENLPINKNYQQKHYVFIMILSSWENSGRRDHIRDTWATYDWFKNSSLTYTYKFVISQPMKGKEYAHQPTDLNSTDMLIADLNEHYYLLDVKVFWGFSEVLQTEMFDYILKVDDDTFVNLFRLPDKINSSGAATYLYGGHLIVTRKWTNSKQKVRYAAGCGYVMSRKALCAAVFGHAVYSSSLDPGDKRIPIEDVYTGFILTNKMQIPFKAMPGFSANHETCRDFTSVLFHHIKMASFRTLLIAAVNGTHFC